MKGSDSSQRRRLRPLPKSPPGTEADLRAILRLLHNDASPPDDLALSIKRVAAQVLARERACREARGTAPAIASLDRAIVAVRRLEAACNAIPPPLDTIVVHRLRQGGFQDDALACPSRILEESRAWAMAKITGSPDGHLTKGPPDLVTRLDGDGVEKLLHEAAALFSTARGETSFSTDIASPFAKVVVALWAYATGEDEFANLPRRLAQFAKDEARRAKTSAR